MTTADAPALAYSSAPGRWVLAVTVLGSGIASLDATVVSIALPVIGRGFHTGVAALQWVVNGYTLTLAAFPLVGGSLGDPVRQAEGLPDRDRVVHRGLGGRRRAADRRLPDLGRVLAVDLLHQRPPRGSRCRARRPSRPRVARPCRHRRHRLPGALAAVVFLTGITFAFIEAPTLGWSSPAMLTMTVAGVAGLAAFLAREHRAAWPMLPLAIFRDRQFAATNAVTFIVYAALVGATFLLPVVLQIVWGYSPLASGLALLPLTIICWRCLPGRENSRPGSDPACR